MPSLAPLPATSTTLDAPRLNAQLELAKWLAIATMVVDHFGFILAPQIEILRLAGRFSLPLFLFVIALRLAQKPDRAEGYLIRLSLWTILSQIPFWFAFLSPAHKDLLAQLNIMATLAIGTALTLLADTMQTQGRKAQLIGWPLAAALLALATHCDYGVFGAVSIPVLVYLARQNPVHAAIGCGVMAALANIINLWPRPEMIGWGVFALLGSSIAYRCLSSTAKPWRMPGWFFYAFYPVHITLLVLLLKALTH